MQLYPTLQLSPQKPTIFKKFRGNLAQKSGILGVANV
jgi:hypothetical protein